MTARDQGFDKKKVMVMHVLKDVSLFVWMFLFKPQLTRSNFTFFFSFGNKVHKRPVHTAQYGTEPIRYVMLHFWDRRLQIVQNNKLEVHQRWQWNECISDRSLFIA